MSLLRLPTRRGSYYLFDSFDGHIYWINRSSKKACKCAYLSIGRYFHASMDVDYCDARYSDLHSNHSHPPHKRSLFEKALILWSAFLHLFRHPVIFNGSTALRVAIGEWKRLLDLNIETFYSSHKGALSTMSKACFRRSSLAVKFLNSLGSFHYEAALQHYLNGCPTYWSDEPQHYLPRCYELPLVRFFYRDDGTLHPNVAYYLKNSKKNSNLVRYLSKNLEDSSSTSSDSETSSWLFSESFHTPVQESPAPSPVKTVPESLPSSSGSNRPDPAVSNSRSGHHDKRIRDIESSSSEDESSPPPKKVGTLPCGTDVLKNWSVTLSKVHGSPNGSEMLLTPESSRSDSSSDVSSVVIQSPSLVSREIIENLEIEDLGIFNLSEFSSFYKENLSRFQGQSPVDKLRYRLRPSYQASSIVSLDPRVVELYRDFVKVQFEAFFREFPETRISSFLQNPSRTPTPHPDDSVNAVSVPNSNPERLMISETVRADSGSIYNLSSEILRGFNPEILAALDRYLLKE